MQIRRAKRSDIPNINRLLNSYGLQTIDNSYINPRDICLVAVEGEQVIGMLWAGLMRQNKEAYLDYFTVDAKAAKQGVGNALAHEMLSICHKLRVEKVFGIIERGKHHDQSAINALKMGMYARELPYTYVYGQINHIIHELNNIQESA